jgi:ankyrin repeat protein
LKTPLHLAVTNGNVRMLQLLLDHGANVEAKDAVSMPPSSLLPLPSVMKGAMWATQSPHQINLIAPLEIVSPHSAARAHGASLCRTEDE